MISLENEEFLFLFIFRHEINSEESDGISVISESEIISKANSADSDNEMEKTMQPETDDSDNYAPLTPPLTPHPQITAIKEFQESFKQEPHPTDRTSQSNCIFWIGIAVCLLAAISYSQISSLKQEILSINMKITQLQHENQMLKIQLDEIQVAAGPPKSYTVDHQESPAVANPQKFEEDVHDYDVNKLKTKTVWLGNEQEGEVKIIDKKKNAMLPDYCYFTEQDDLFYDYNNEICENKRRKLEAKNAKENTKESKNQKLPEPEEVIKTDDFLAVDENIPYDSDYVSEVMKSLYDEIQEIKRSTPEGELKGIQQPNADQDVAKPEEVPKQRQEKPRQEERQEKPRKSMNSEERRQKKRFSRPQAVNSGEWVEKRMSGREEARKDQEKRHQEINWYLKRKNDRENIRGAGSQNL